MDLPRFGFTPTETKVYLALLRLEPATGYALAREARLARANTYGALDALVRRGAAARLPGRPARYAAVEPATLVERLRSEFAREADTLARDLASFARHGTRAAPPAVELLEGRTALIGRASRCAQAARDELLAVFGPWIPEIYPDLVATRGTARSVRLLCLGEPAPEGAAVRSVVVAEVEAYWGGLPLLMVADHRQAVSGIFGAGGGEALGMAGRHAGLVPFLRHLLRRELATAQVPRLS